MFLEREIYPNGAGSSFTLNVVVGVYLCTDVDASGKLGVKNTMLAIVLHARDNSKNLEKLELLLEGNILTDQWTC